MNYSNAKLTTDAIDNFVLVHDHRKGECLDEYGNYCSPECAEFDQTDMSGSGDIIGFANER